MADIRDLPDEVMLLVLTILFSHTSIYSSLIPLGPSSTYARILRCKSSLTLVCKNWNPLATPFLYQEIVIRRPGQIKSLLHTLVDTNHAVLIREFVVYKSCFVDLTYDDRHLFAKNVASLIRLCPQITSLKLQPFYSMIIPNVKSTFSKANLGNLVALELGLTFNPDPDSKDRRHVLTELSDNLRSLSLYITGAPSSQTMLDSSIEFPSLTRLRFIFHLPISPDLGIEPNSQLPAGMPLLPTLWSLPALESLSLRFSTSARLYEECIGAFVEQYGRRLRFLGFNAERKGDGPVYILPHLIHCPQIEHLSIDRLPPSPDGGIHGISVPSLKTLDIFTNPEDTPSNSKWSEVRSSELFIEVTTALFPNLSVLRFFSQFSVENIFSPPLGISYENPIDVIEEAFSWLRPDSEPEMRMDVKHIDRASFVRVARDPGDNGQEGKQRYIHITVVHPPSPYHPMADEWGDEQDPLFYLGSPTPSEDEESDSNQEDGAGSGTSDSYSDTSHDSEYWVSDDDEYSEAPES